MINNETVRNLKKHAPKTNNWDQFQLSARRRNKSSSSDRASGLVESIERSDVSTFQPPEPQIRPVSPDRSLVLSRPA